MARSAKIFSSDIVHMDLEAQPLLPVSEETTEEPSFAKQRASKWLRLDNDEQYYQYYNFLIEQSAHSSIYLCVFTLQILFGFFILRLFTTGAVYETGGVPMLIGRGIRFMSCCFGWFHLYFLKQSNKNDSNKMKAVFCAGQFMLWIAISGCVMLLVRTWNGQCGENEFEDICNPRHDQRGVPLDTFGGNLLFIVILPLIFKAHRTSYICLSYCLTIAGLVAASITAKATNDNVTILALCIAFGTLIYDNKRNMMTMYIVLQGQWSYYDRMLKIERNKVNAEMESVELRKLIGSVAHDLKTPLQAIMVELDGLQSEVNGVRQHTVGLANMNSPAVSKHSNEITTHTDEVQKYIESLKDVYQFMMMTINRAIEYRKMASGIQLMSTKETFHLGSAVDWVVARFSNNPSGVQIRVENKLGDKYCPYLITDKHWLTENLLTLLSNACKFTTKGEIMVRCSVIINENGGRRLSKSEKSNSSLLTLKEEPSSDYIPERMSSERVASSSDSEIKYVRIEVEDTGIGVNPSQVKYLFKPFGKTQRRVGGTGLGLHTLKARVEALKGRCGFSHRSDGLAGCCFWFTIPYVPDSVIWEECLSRDEHSISGMLRFNSERDSARISNPGEQVSPVNSISQKFPHVLTCSNRRVLVVDDSTLILKTTSRMLRKEGFEVETAQNGEDALRMMISNNYLFILSDIQMPVMDGLEMTKRIREMENSCHNSTIPPRYIIGMSANSDTQTRDDSLLCGMNDFVSKPVRMNNLVKLMQTSSTSEVVENIE